MTARTALGAAIVTVTPSNGRLRTELRRPSDGGSPPIPTVDAEPFQDPKTGRIINGRAAARRRQLKAKAKGISTLDPKHSASWLTPHIRDAQEYAATLLARFPDPALARLVGATCDAHVMSKAMLALAATGDKTALSEARAWAREHRACLRELSALAGLVSEENEDGPRDPLAKWRENE